MCSVHTSMSGSDKFSAHPGNVNSTPRYRPTSDYLPSLDEEVPTGWVEIRRTPSGRIKQRNLSIASSGSDGFSQSGSGCGHSSRTSSLSDLEYSPARARGESLSSLTEASLASEHPVMKYLESQCEFACGYKTIKAESLHQLLRGLEHGSSEFSSGMIALYINTFPSACQDRDADGRLPLHIAVDCDSPIIDIVRLLMKAYSIGVRSCDFAGFVPLFLACSRSHPNQEVLRLLLHSYPVAVNLKVKNDCVLNYYTRHAHWCDPGILAFMVRINASSVRQVSFIGGNFPLFDLITDKDSGCLHGSRVSMAAFELLLRNTPLSLILRGNFCGVTIVGALMLRRDNLAGRDLHSCTCRSCTGIGLTGSASLSIAMSEQVISVDKCLRRLLILLTRGEKYTTSTEMMHTLKDLNFASRLSALLISLKPHKPRGNIFAALMDSCSDVWREVLTFL